jgi:hypothetical protein
MKLAQVGIVTGYNITYCRADPESTSKACLTHEAPADAEHAWIKDLEPWTEYKVLNR